MIHLSRRLRSLSLALISLLVGCADEGTPPPTCNGASCVCEAEQTCEVSSDACGPGSCSVDCAEDSVCEGSCGDSCSVDCSAGASCTLTVGPSASVSCAAGSSCDITCTASCSVSCAEATVCTLTCADGEPQMLTEGGECPG